MKSIEQKAPMATIDLNADVGEGVGDDAALIPLVTSASIACGAHAGDEQTMKTAITAAAQAGVMIGAHPGHADQEGFGRRRIPITPANFESLVAEQVERLQRIAERLGAEVRYIKLHGALYHQAAADPALAAAAARVATRTGRGFAILGPPRCELASAAAAAGVHYAAEGFADRRYRSDGTLTPRALPGAVLDDPGLAAEQAARLAIQGEALAGCGAPVKVPCDSLCLHGDRPGAVLMAEQVREALLKAGVRLRAFAPSRCV